MSLIRKHGAVLQAWACLALVFRSCHEFVSSIRYFAYGIPSIVSWLLTSHSVQQGTKIQSRLQPTPCTAYGHYAISTHLYLIMQKHFLCVQIAFLSRAVATGFSSLFRSNGCLIIQEIWANAHETRDSISLISYAGCLGLSPVHFGENSL